MKKTGMIVFSGLVLMLSSCSKSYVCECIYTNQEDADDTYRTTTELKNTKKEAEKNCDYLSGTSYSGQLTYDVDCSISE